VYEPEDPQPGEQLLVSNVQAVPAQHRGWVPLAVGVQHLGLGKPGLYRRSFTGGRIGRGQGWLPGAVRRRRVAYPLRLEHISGSWLKGAIRVELSKLIQAIVGTPSTLVAGEDLNLRPLGYEQAERRCNPSREADGRYLTSRV
jgi:hypothetical protein